MKKRITTQNIFVRVITLVGVLVLAMGFQPFHTEHFAAKSWRLLTSKVKQQLHIAATAQAGSADLNGWLVDDPCTGANLGGIVWQDYNSNGVKDASETVGIPNITVQVYDCNGIMVASDVTDNYGNWYVNPAGFSFPVRVEFSNIPAWANSTFNGTHSATSVQFVSAASCNVHFGIASPSDYCGAANPPIVLACYEAGNAFYGATGNENKGIISFPYNSSGPTPTGITGVAKIYEVGTVWGMGWQRKHKRMFTSTLLKRHSGLGPKGMGGVYVMDFSSGTGSVITSFDLQGVAPSNGGPAINLGTINRTGTDYALPNANNVDSWDLDAFDKIGKVGFGDADISPDENTLWLVNLNQRALITVDVSSTSSYPGTVKQYPLSSATGLPSCTNGVLRPWGLAFDKGRGYLGCVCTAESGGTPANLHAYVLSFDPANPTAFTTEVSFPLNYTREKAVDFPTYSLDIPGAWRPWVSTWAGTGYSNNPPSETGYPQPIVSDIDFADNGSMVIGIADRFGFQMGRANYIPVSGDNSQTSGDVAGDIIKVCRIDGNWVMEGGAGCAENDDASKSALGNDGPSSTGEFYYQDSFDDTNATPTYNHNETFIGSVGVVKGKNEVVAVHYDPINGANFAWDLGVLWHSPATGARTDQFRIIDTGPAESKGNGLGDVDMVCNTAPIQIGNIVWDDADFDGVQDPCEAGLNGVVVKLYKMDAGTTTLIATTSTATVNGKSGSWFFRDYEQYGTAYDTLTPGKMYFITLGEAGQFNTSSKVLSISGTSYELTSKDNGEGTNPDLNDSDAYLLSDNSKPFDKYPVMTVTIGNPGYVNHTLDAGFALLRPPYIGPDHVVCNDGTVEFIAYPNTANLTDSIPGTWVVHVQDGSEADPPGAVGDSILTIAFNNQNFVALVDTVIFTAANGLKDTALVTVLPTIKGAENYSGCEGDGYSVTVNGVVYDESNPSGTQIMTGYQGCDSIVTINLVYNSVAIFSSVNNVTTYGGNDGSIDLSLVTHNSPYTFDWDNDGVGDNDDPEDLSGLAAGNYNVTITDASGCTKVESFTVTQPPCDLSLSMNLLDVTCHGGADGEIDLVISGGIAPFTFDWDNDGTGDNDDPEDLTGLAAGAYAVTVTDASGCTTEGSFDINQPNAINLSGIVTDPTAPGSNDGMIDLSPSGGTLPYTFDWSNDGTGDNDDPEDISGLAPGTYFLTLTDGTGCTKTTSFTVNASSCNLSLNMDIQDVTCHAGLDGELDMTIIGGTGPFTIDWDNDGVGDNDDSEDLTGLAAGTYAVMVTDVHGCTATGTFDINEPSAVGVSGVVTNVSVIGGDDGAIDLTVAGGTLPYTFDWDNDGVGDYNDPEDLTNLAAGNYSVTVNDAVGCPGTASFTVTEPPCALSLLVDVHDVTCNGLMDGALDLTIVNGAAPYTIDWSNDGTGDNDDPEDLTGLAGGSYFVTVTDDNGCSKTGTYSVSEPAALSVNWLVVDVSSNGGNDGFINLTITGGISPFTFDWDNDGIGDNDDTEDLTDLTAGDYGVTITDAGGCTATALITVNQPSCDLSLTADSQDVSCFGGSNGAIDLTVTGSAMPFTFDWDSDGTGDNNDPEDLAGLDADTYAVTVTDANGCTATGSYGVSEPNEIVLSAIIGPISGMGVDDGWIDLTVTGGTPPFTYDWSNDGTGDNNDPQDIGGLAPGTYLVTVTDGAGCTKTGSYVISPADFFDLALRKTPATGQATTVQPGATITYTITVFNQGSVGAADILVIDYLQSHMTFSSSDNPGWVNFGAGPTWFISSLPAGASISQNIKLKVATNAPNGAVTNYAEISAADDDDPNTFDPPVDIDSNPNAYQFDDPGGQPGGPADDVITGDGTGAPGSNNPATDEDDHDGASIQVLTPTLSLGNLVFADLNNDGIFNNMEPGISGVGVQLFNAGPDQQANTPDDQFVASQITNGTGNYLFTGLSAGYYFVKLMGVGIPANYVSSTGQGVMDYDGAGPYEPATGTDLNVDNTDDGTQMGTMVLSGVIQLTLNGEPEGNINNTVDFGLYEPQLPTLSLGGTIFSDDNNDGVFSNPETGIGAVEVELYSAGPDQIKGNNDDQLLGSQLTLANGDYLFTGLPEGVYYVKLTGAGIPAFHVSSTGEGVFDGDGAGPYEPAPGADNDVDGVDDGSQMGAMVMSDIIELTINGEPDGNENYTVDFGLYEPQSLSLGNLVFADLENDGIFNNSDYGLQGVEVQLFSAGPDEAAGTPDDQLLDSQLTNADGEYLFTGLVEGFYFVKLTGLGIPANHISATGDGINDMDGMGPFEPATGTNNDVDGTDDGTQMGLMVLSEVIELTLNGEPDGNVNNTVDFGLYEPFVQPTLSLGNLVFSDKNNDGLFNANDAGIAGVEVELYDAGPDEIKGTPDDQLMDSQLTNLAGEYLFSGLPEGFYFVKLTGIGIPANHVSSTGDGIFDNDGAGPYEPATGTNNDVDGNDDGTQMGAMVMSGVIELAFNTEPNGNDNYTVDFGLYEPILAASLGNFVWNDTNHNGQQDNNEPGVPNVGVNLFSTGPDGVKGGGDDSLYASQLTNAGGIYYFQNIIPGKYYVVFDLSSLPTNYHPTTPNLGNDLTDSDVDAMGMTTVITLAPNEVNVSIDFGIESAPSNIGNFVWQDYDGDNLQDAGEPGVEGITVNLYDLGNDGVKGGNDDNLLATDITDTNGEYGFMNLNPGSYYVVFDPQSYPSGFVPAAQDAGGNDALDSDANAMGMTDVIVLGAGEDNDSVDLGIFSDEFDLSLTKTLSPGQSNQVDVGDVIAYTITVLNEGPNPVYTIKVVDHFPAGLILSSNNPGWSLIGPNMAEYTIPGPIMPGQATAVEILLRVQYAASGATLQNKAEVTSVEDINGDVVTDVDSTPDNDEPDEDDIDDAEVELIPHDPTGWIYCDKTGKIITGGTISVTGPNGIPNSQVIIIHDGIDGYYEFYTDGTPGVYTLSYTHPLGYPLGLNCTDQPGPFDPTGMPNPIVFGVDTVNAMYLSDPTCANNPYYLTFDIEPGDPNINLNNLPVSCTFIGSIVCDDANLNDAIDAGDTPTPGATVYLYDCADLTMPIDSVISDGAGRYRFDGLLPGDYVVGFGLTSGYRFVSSGNMNQTGFSDCITLAWGQCDTTKAICLYPCPTINAGPDIDHCSSANSSQLDANLSHGIGGFTWTPPFGLNNPNIENPVASPDSTTTYYISFNDGFGCVAFDTIVVSVGTSVPYMTNMPFTDSTAQCAPLPFDPPIFADDCDTSLTIVTDTIITPQPCGYIQEVTWTATNDEGNSASFIQTITVEDTIAPTMSASHPFFGPIMHGDTLYADCSMIPALDSLGFAAFDNCSATTVTFTENITNGNCPVDGYYQQRYCGWTATDACGNTDSLFFNVIIYDNSPPSLSPAPGDVTVSCSAIPPPATLSATDNCDASPTIDLDEYITADSNGCINQILRVWTAEDDCGNTTVATQTITVFDNTPPTLAGVPANANLDCATPVPAPANVTATDDCDSDVPVSFNQTVNGNSATGCYSITRTWTATDDCGNTVSASQTITITDTTPPTLAGVPADANYDCSQSVPFAAPVTASDNCDSDVPVIFSEVITGNSSSGCFTIVRTWTATDDCGNTVSASQTINVTDTAPPTLSGVPASTTIPCEQSVPAPATVTASDACDANVPVVYIQNINGNPSTGCYVITRTWTATDDCGNSVSASQTITVEDQTAPTLSAYPANMTVTCTSEIPAAPTITATDNCDPDSPVLYFESYTGNPSGCNYQLMRTWAAADDCGNVVAWTQTISVNDNTPPVLSGVPANTTINCGTPVPPAATVTATDNCDPNVPVTLTTTYIGDPTSGCYIVVRTWTAADDCGNSVSAKQEIGVIDNTAPNLVGLPANGAYNCDNLPGSNVTATDNCDTNVPVIITDHIQSSVNGCPTQIVRTWTASDDCGNTRVASRTFNVTNNSAPTITILVPALAGVQNGDTLYLECHDLPGLSASSVAASGDCCGAANVTFHETVSLANCQSDGYLAEMNCGWIATDCCGNSSSLFFTVFMIDLTPPELYGVPDDLILPVGSSVPPPPTVVAVDNCDNSMPISYNSTTTGPPTNQTTTRSWSATDDCGNTVTETQVIWITSDTTAPILSNVPADITIEGPVANLPSSAGVTATDNLDNNPEINFVENRTGGICCYVVTRTWTATDDFGNSSTATQTITVTDTQAPVIAGTVTDVTAVCSLGDVPMPQLSATDNCTDVLTQNFTADTTMLNCGYHILRTWTFTDECGNEAIAQQNIQVEDNEGPTFDPASAISLDFVASQNATANGGVSLAIGDKISPNQTWTIGNQTMPNFAAIASDNCTTAHEIGYRVSNIEEINNGCEHSFVVSFQVLDACGNAATALFTASASFTDDAAPSFASLPQDQSVTCGNVPAPAALTATDNNGAVTIAFEEVETPGCPTILTRTWTATDGCGNSTVAEQKITVTDNAAPQIINVPASVVVSCGNVPPVSASVSAMDNCSAVLPLTFTETIAGSSCQYTITRTWTAVDACGNSAIKQQYIWVADHQAPAIVAGPPANLTVSCDAALPPAANITVSDNCDASPAISFEETVLPGNDPAGANCSYAVLRKWTVTDACGNKSVAEQTITVTDNTLPTLANIPSDITVNCGNIPGAPTILGGDNCDTDVEVIFKETTVTGCPFKVVRNWIAVDNCGNQAEATQTIVVVDNQPPVLSAAPANLSLTCGTAVPAPAMLTATDDCGLPTSVTMQETDSGTGCNRTIQRTWTATDACGNSSSVSQLITFTDTAAPTGIAPADLTVNCGELPPATTPTFTDNCDQNLSVHFTEIATPVNCGENVLRTWTATDDCGNSTVLKQLIHVRDLTAPALAFANPVLAGLSSGDTLLFNCANNIIFNTSDVTATDACSNVAVSLELVDVSNGNCLADSYLMRAKFRWVATDDCGNTSTLSLNIRVEDNEAPVFPNLPNVVVNCGEAVPDFITPDVVDDCGEVALSFASQNVPTGYGHNIVGTWTATDNCGNTASATQTMQVFDMGAAQLVGVPANVTIDLSMGETIPPAANVTAVDNCNGNPLPLTFDEDIQQIDPCNTVIDRRWSAVGPNGVTVMETQTITVIDNANFTADMVADSCNTSNGSVVLTPASFDFVWSDPNGATGMTGAVRNDLAAGTYTVTATNANGCSSVAEVIVEEYCNCDAANVKEVKKNTTGCGVSKGKAVIHLVQNVADYNFTWSPNLGVPNIVGNARTSLPAGHYEVTISLNSLASCMTVVSFDIDDDCAGCDEIFAEAPTSVNAPHGPVDICLPVAYGVSSSYEIRVDGHLFGGMLEPCEPHAVKVYNYATMPTGGSYSVVWQHDGQTFYTFVKNFAELTAAMNHADPNGNWYDDAASKELVTTRLNGNYGTLSIRHTASGTMTNLAAIATTSNTGTMLTLPSGGHTITYTNTVTGCSDDIYVYIGTDETEVALEQPTEGAQSAQPGTEVETRATEPKGKADGILVYNGFSPNGDGKNDFFKISGLEHYPEHELKIYNGSGKMVFRTNHYLSDWGGSWGQNNLPDGTYYYLLEDGKGKTYSGYVQIKR